jgi:hypothetical protein
MSKLVTINDHGIESLTLTVNENDFCSADARLAGDLEVLPGDPVTLAIGNDRILLDVSEFGAIAADRYNLCAFSRGSDKLRDMCTPTHITHPSTSSIFSAFGISNYKTLSEPTGLPDYGIIIPGSITKWQALQRYFGPFVRALYDGTIEVGRRPVSKNGGKFNVLDYNAQSGILMLGIVDDFKILPRDQLYGATVANVTYYYGSDELRATCQMESTPTLEGNA